MRSRARDLTGPQAGRAIQPTRRGSRRWLRAQVGAGALSAVLTLVVGVVSAADVCKLSVCWVSLQAKHDYECSEGCYFENNPLDDSPAAQCNVLAEHELDVEYMYRDTSTDTTGVGCDGGCITIGIGNKFESVDDAVALQGSFFITGDDGVQRAATEQEIRDEFNNLARQPANCSNNNTASCYAYTHWRTRTNLVLSDEARNGLCQGRLSNEFIPGLQRIYGADEWNAMPTTVQYALIDMAYNLGTEGLRRNWPRFNRAIRNQDWAAAATDSNRPQLSDERNAYVRDLLEAADAEKRAGEARLANCTP